MAAYAAVVSMMNTMNAVMNDPRLSSCFDNIQIQSLGEKLGVLLHFIENYNSLARDKEVEFLERIISSAAHAAEDVVEKHIVDQIRAGVLKKKAPTSMIDLHQTIQSINLIKRVVVKVEEKSGTNNEYPKYSTSAADVAASSQPPLITTGKTTTMVGFDDYLLQLLDGLTGHDSELQVIPIVGMGGVGKTTLTRNAYEDPLTVEHFDVRSWVSISQQYDVKNILMQLLSTLGQSAEENKNESELSECLYKFLFGRRYLIVLDDMWSIKAWDKIKFCFPEDGNGSRIIVSTRLLEVANVLGVSRVIRVGLLDETKSWDLFCLKAFAQHEGCCPAELEQIGKKIVEKCNGLPLSIVVIGALLEKSSRETEYWENIAENMSSILSSGEDILCLSYIHLPAHLKPCFLYLGIFGEDRVIHVSQLVKLWVSEGFIKPNKDERRSLEEVAEGYINDLFERAPLSDADEEIVLHNFQTLMIVHDLRCSEEVCKRIPNIKRLHLCYDDVLSNDDYCCLENVGRRLNKLESLSYKFTEVPNRDRLLQNLTVPTSLKQLSLDGSWLHWDDDMMRIIGSLLNLEFLKLDCGSFKGREWNCVEGEFLRLKYLYLGYLILEEWKAESSHFPVLETLVLDDMEDLEEIPSCIGDIPTLTCIHLNICFNSVNLSAIKILEEQESQGNDALQMSRTFLCNFFPA